MNYLNESWMNWTRMNHFDVNHLKTSTNKVEQPNWDFRKKWGLSRTCYTSVRTLWVKKRIYFFAIFLHSSDNNSRWQSTRLLNLPYLLNDMFLQKKYLYFWPFRFVIKAYCLEDVKVLTALFYMALLSFTFLNFWQVQKICTNR